jgi:hypothetical protein
MFAVSPSARGGICALTKRLRGSGQTGRCPTNVSTCRKRRAGPLALLGSPRERHGDAHSCVRTRSGTLAITPRSGGFREWIDPAQHTARRGEWIDALLLRQAVVRDIEELGELGKRLGACPYYGTRKAARAAEVRSAWAYDTAERQPWHRACCVGFFVRIYDLITCAVHPVHPSCIRVQMLLLLRAGLQSSS